MRAIKVLSVCGSGTVSSAMLSSKLADIFEEKGYEMEATEVSPGGVPGAMPQVSLWALMKRNLLKN